MDAPTEKGTLTIRDITVPLKQDYIRKLAAGITISDLKILPEIPNFFLHFVRYNQWTSSRLFTKVQ